MMQNYYKIINLQIQPEKLSQYQEYVDKNQYQSEESDYL